MSSSLSHAAPPVCAEGARGEPVSDGWLRFKLPDATYQLAGADLAATAVVDQAGGQHSGRAVQESQQVVTSAERLNAAIEEQAHRGPTVPSTMESAWDDFYLHSTLKPSVPSVPASAPIVRAPVMAPQAAVTAPVAPALVPVWRAELNIYRRR